MVVRMIVGLVLTTAALAIAGRRLWWLKRLAFSGQPAPERLDYARSRDVTGSGQAGRASRARSE